jgi:hypothetical protein
LYDFYRDNDFALPGEPRGYPEKFVTHECYHLLSGYGLSPAEEMLVAAFTGADSGR